MEINKTIRKNINDGKYTVAFPRYPEKSNILSKNILDLTISELQLIPTLQESYKKEVDLHTKHCKNYWKDVDQKREELYEDCCEAYELDKNSEFMKQCHVFIVRYQHSVISYSEKFTEMLPIMKLYMEKT